MSPTMKEIMQDIMTKPTVPLWPHTGRVFSLGRNKTYEEGKPGGSIKTLDKRIRKSSRHHGSVESSACPSRTSNRSGRPRVCERPKNVWGLTDIP